MMYGTCGTFLSGTWRTSLRQRNWGSMINDGRSMLQISPWMVLAPGVAIFITVMIFNLLGDTLRDYMDPKQRAKNKREEKNK